MKNRWRPPQILSVSLRYSLSCLTRHNILSGSSGLRWAIPGTVIHSGACDGSWFLVKNQASVNKDTTFWHWVFPLLNTHLPDATLSAWKYDRLCAMILAMLATVPESSVSLVGLPSTSWTHLWTAWLLFPEWWVEDLAGLLKMPTRPLLAEPTEELWSCLSNSRSSGTMLWRPPLDWLKS